MLVGLHALRKEFREGKLGQAVTLKASKHCEGLDLSANDRWILVARANSSWGEDVLETSFSPKENADILPPRVATGIPKSHKTFFPSKIICKLWMYVFHSRTTMYYLLKYLSLFLPNLSWARSGNRCAEEKVMCASEVERMQGLVSPVLFLFVHVSPAPLLPSQGQI